MIPACMFIKLNYKYRQPGLRDPATDARDLWEQEYDMFPLQQYESEPHWGPGDTILESIT